MRVASPETTVWKRFFVSFFAGTKNENRRLVKGCLLIHSSVIWLYTSKVYWELCPIYQAMKTNKHMSIFYIKTAKINFKKIKKDC